MTNITLKASGASLSAKVDGKITSGMVGVLVNVEYDYAWDGLIKTVIFRVGSFARVRKNVGTATTVPWEVLRIPGGVLSIGIEGRTEDGNIVIPTIWATASRILPGANGEIPAAPNPDSEDAGSGGGAVIDDSQTSANTTWSSKKISEEIANADPESGESKPKLLWELRVPGTKHGFNQTQSWDDENKYFQVWDPVHGDIRWNRYWYEDVNLEPDVYLAELFQELFANLDGHIPVRVEMEINDILYTVGYPTRTTCYVDGHVMDRVMILCSDPTVDCTTYSDLTVVELSRFGLFCSFSVGVAATYNGWNVRVYGQEENGNVQAGPGGSVEGAVLYTEQKLTEEQQTQARANIGAVQQGTFGIIIQGKSGRAEMEVYDVPDDAGDKHTILNMMGYEDGPVVLRHIADGVEDYDAATVGQLNAAIGDISAALNSTVKSVNGQTPDENGNVEIKTDANTQVVPSDAVLNLETWKYIYAGSGSLFGKDYADSKWRYTAEYVPCDGAVRINLLINSLDGTTQGRGLVFYDVDKTPIIGHVFPTEEDHSLDMTYDVPENAAYFRTCIKAIYVDDFFADLVYEKNIEGMIEDEIERATAAEAALASRFTLADKKVLIIGDSISTDNNSTGINYGNYEKWVGKLIKQGFFSADNVTNDSIHATGFVASLSGDGTDCFLPRLQAVTNPEEYDIVIIFGGINDFIKAKPYADFTAAVDAFFEYLTNTFINSRICIFRPLRTSNTSGVGNYDQQDYSEYIGSVAKSYCLPVLNLTEESGFYPWIPAFKNRWTFTGWTGGDGTTGDGVHPNEEWEETRLAPMIKNFLKGLIK